MYLIKEDGGLFVKDFILPNQFVLAAFNPQQTNLASIGVLQDAVLLEAHYSKIQRLFEQDHRLAKMAKNDMEARLEKIYHRMESFVIMDSERRYRSFQQDFGGFENGIPQYIIASYLGVTPTQLSRIRKKIKNVDPLNIGK